MPGLRVPGKTVRWFKRIRTRGKQFDCAPRMRPSRLLEDGVSLSRRDLTMVARHEMPGMGAITDPSGKGRYDFVPRLNHAPDQKSAVCRPNHTVPLGRAFSLTSSRHFMPGYPHSVPPGRSACSLNRFSTHRAVGRHRKVFTRRRMSCLWVSISGHKKISRGFCRGEVYNQT
jgi:hypothetical protein